MWFYAIPDFYAFFTLSKEEIIATTHTNKRQKYIKTSVPLRSIQTDFVFIFVDFVFVIM